MPNNWNEQLRSPIDYLKTEAVSASLLLLETGDQIVLEQTGQSDNLWANQTKH